MPLCSIYPSLSLAQHHLLQHPGEASLTQKEGYRDSPLCLASLMLLLCYSCSLPPPSFPLPPSLTPSLSLPESSLPVLHEACKAGGGLRCVFWTIIYLFSRSERGISIRLCRLVLTAFNSNTLHSQTKAPCDGATALNLARTHLLPPSASPPLTVSTQTHIAHCAPSRDTFPRHKNRPTRRRFM